MKKTKRGKQLAALVAAGGLWAWQNRDRIRDFLRSEQVAQALKTPEAQRVVNSATVRRIVEHPQVRSLIEHPEFQRWLNGQQPGAAGGDGPEPYTGETRRL